VEVSVTAHRLNEEPPDPSIKGLVVYGMVAHRPPDEIRAEIASHLWHFSEDELRIAYQAARAMSNILGLELRRRQGG
jgi:hypothetical protein